MRHPTNSSSVADSCSKCGALSYRGGYCFSCGVYRPSKSSEAGQNLDLYDYFKLGFGTRLDEEPLTEELFNEWLDQAIQRKKSAKKKEPGLITRPRPLVTFTETSLDEASLLVQAVVQPISLAEEGRIVKALEIPWRAIVKLLKDDWAHAMKIPPHIWEEMIAAAFDQEGYDDVILTPRSGDLGRDVIAVKNGVGSIRIINSVKAYKPGHLVKHDDVRALAGVLHGDPKASKGILSTTSDFAPTIKTDPLLAPFMPYRLELMNGQTLQKWLHEVASK